jgi:hypothetical protein
VLFLGPSHQSNARIGRWIDNTHDLGLPRYLSALCHFDDFVDKLITCQVGIKDGTRCPRLSWYAKSVYQVQVYREGPLGYLTCLSRALGRVGMWPGDWLSQTRCPFLVRWALWVQSLDSNPRGLSRVKKLTGGNPIGRTMPFLKKDLMDFVNLSFYRV